MPGDAENVGGIKIEAEIELGKLESSTKKLDQTLATLDPHFKKTEQGLTRIEKTADGAAKGIERASFASRVFSALLGYLGATSINQVVYRLVDLTKRALGLSVELKALESQARAVFGEAFPQMREQAEALGKQFQRSSSDVLKYMAGFGDFLDQLGFAPAAIQNLSGQLAQLTLSFGKLKPNIPDSQIFEALQQGLAGNYRALRQLDILVKDDTLQQYANGLAIRNKVKDLDSEQKALLVTLYLQDQLKRKQEEVARATGDLGDEAKSLSAEWQDMMEVMGTALAPIVAEALKGVRELLQGVVQDIDAINSRFAFLARLETFKRAGVKPEDIEIDPRTGFPIDVSAVPRSRRGQHILDTANTALPQPTTGAQPFDPLDTLNRTPRKAGGGGTDPEAERKKILQDIAQIEKSLIDAVGKQATKNADRLRQTRDELDLRRRMGVITERESRELDRINARIEFGKDRIQEATKAWEEQADTVQTLKERVAELNDQLKDQNEELQRQLEEIDAEAGRSKEEKAADLIRELRALDDKIARREGNTLEEQARRAQIEAALASVGAETVGRGTELANMNEFQLIDEETRQKKLDAVAEANRRQQETTDELTRANLELEAAERAEIAAKEAVVQAIDAYKTKVDTTFPLIKQATTDFVNQQIAEWNRLQAAIAGANNTQVRGIEQNVTQAFAQGGNVHGPGTGTSDSIVARLSNGERVITAVKNRLYGPILDMIHRGTFPIPRYSEGGVVTNNNQRSASINVNNYGKAAEVYADPRRARWDARTFLG